MGLKDSILNHHKCRVATVDEISDYIDDIDTIMSLEPKLNAAKRPWKPQGTKGTANGMKFDSRWEWAFYKYMTEKEGYVVERNRVEKLHYTDDKGKLRNFYPDFIVGGQFYEVKGIIRPADEAKMSQCPNVVFVFGEEIKPMIKWLNKNCPGWYNEYQETLL